MKCRYCADMLRVVNEKLFSPFGEKCAANPDGFHVAVTDGTACVYCGTPPAKSGIVGLKANTNFIKIEFKKIKISIHRKMKK